jgi:hypothetical protein
MTIALMLAAVAALLAAPMLALAAGAGPDDALIPDESWREITDGQRHWYTFQYDGGDGQIEINMDLEPANAVAFKVITPDNLRVWQSEGELNAIGAGSPNAALPADLVWSGGFNLRGAYYVVVEHTGVRSGPAYYSLGVSGDGVWFPEAMAEEPQAPAAVDEEMGGAGAVEEMAMAEAQPAGGTGPDDTLRPTDGWKEIEGGAWVWYAFNYSERNTQIQIALDADPNDSVAFSVWTPDDIQHWASTGEERPVGRGSENEFAPGELSWSGNFASTGTYYVVVQHVGAGPSFYSLSVTGDNVWY